MRSRLWNRIKFEIERFILYRSLHQIILIILVIGLIAVLGGLAAYFLTSDFTTLPEAIWWSFLHLTDPGYIGDDVGGIRRTISTIVSVLGYVFFVGALVAVMTQGLNQAIARLQKGLTPIAQNGHILILGWTNRTPIIVKQLLLSEGRVRHFLMKRGVTRIRITILAEDVRPELMHDLRSFLGNYWDARRLTLRSGTPLRIEHLERVDYRHASVIILPGGEFANEALDYPDGRTLKTLLSMGAIARRDDDEEQASMVAEIRDYRKGSLARAAYGGPIETLESDLFVARLMAQIIRNPGLSHIYHELLTHEIGNEIYLRTYPSLVGERLGDLPPRLPRGIILGLYRNDAQRFYPFPLVVDEKLKKGERLVMIAPGIEEDDLLSRGAATSPVTPPLLSPPQKREREGGKNRRVLLLGWNHSLPALLTELESYTDEEYSVTNLALISREERLSRMNRQGVELRRIQLDLHQGEFTSAAELAEIGPESFDTIIICASEWLETSGESDARTVLGYLVLQEILEKKKEENPDSSPRILAQLMNESNASLFPEEKCETITTPVVLSHLLAQIALQRDLRGVFDELFGSGGAEIYFRPVSLFDLPGDRVDFNAIRAAAFAHGEIAIGLRIASEHQVNGGIVINPTPTLLWDLQEGDEIIVMQDQELGPVNDIPPPQDPPS